MHENEIPRAMHVAACRKTFDTLTGCPKRREIGRMEPEGVYEYSEGCIRAKQAENPLKLDVSRDFVKL